MFLSIIVPCYNEENNLRNGVLHVMAEYLDKQSYHKEVIIVDDGSTDQSTKLIEKFIAKQGNDYFKLIKNPHGGKAATVVKGMLSGTGEIVMFTDMDQATPLEEVEKLLPYFNSDSNNSYDIVFGSRAGKRKGAPIIRRIMARGFMTLRTLILGLNGIRDTQCGFKAFKKEVAQEVFKKLKVNNNNQKVKGSMVAASFDVETLFIARKMGYKMKEVPVQWQHIGSNRVSVIRDSWRGLKDMVKLRINDLQGVYN